MSRPGRRRRARSPSPAPARRPPSVDPAAPAWPAALARPPPRRPGNVVTPGNFTGYGFDQCLAPTQSAMDAWLKHSPFLAVGIYISGDSRACREPAEPHPDLGQHPARARAGGCCRSRSARRRPASTALPPLRRRRDHQAHARARRTATPGPRAGPGARPTRRSPPPGRSASCRAARSGTTSRAFDLTQHPLPRVGAAFLSAWTTRLHELDYVSGVYSSAGLGHQDARRRAGEPAQGVHPARPDLDRPLGRRGQHHHVLHPRRRLAARRPGQAVPGRPRRDLGRRHDQHRPQLPRPRHGLRAPRRRPHCDGSADLNFRLPARSSPGPRRPARSRRCSACSRRRGSTPAALNGRYSAATHRAVARVAGRGHGFAAGTTGAGATG